MVLLTVFTPLYNRKKTLKRTYNSLVNQTNKDFIWLIIDDGSTDNPYQEIEKWMQKDNGFIIRYIYKENGGMHTAHNTAYENIDTELNMCIDSDDYMPPNAVQLISDCWKENRNKGYSGIIALDFAEATQSVIGKELPKDKDSTTLMGYYNNGGYGDKKLIYRTDLITSVPPYPVFEGEKYFSLAYKYHLLDEKYELRILNKSVCIVDYQFDGSSTNMYRQYLNNPKGFAFWRKEQMRHSVNYKQRFKACVHYVSSCLLYKNSRCLKDSPYKLSTFLAMPCGVLLSLFIRYKAKKAFMTVKI